MSQGQVLASHLQNVGLTELFLDHLNIRREAGLVEKSLKNLEHAEIELTIVYVQYV